MGSDIFQEMKYEIHGFDSKKYMRETLQLCHLSFEIVMNSPLIWLRILTTWFLLCGKNCSSDRV